MEAVASEPEAPAPILGQCVGARRLGHVGVEGGVDAGDVRHAGQSCAREIDRIQGRGHVHGRELSHSVEANAQRIIDDGRPRDVRSPVDEAMADRLDVARAFEEVGEGVVRFGAGW